VRGVGFFLVKLQVKMTQMTVMTQKFPWKSGFEGVKLYFDGESG
jgi:hypothetical protein